MISSSVILKEELAMELKLTISHRSPLDSGVQLQRNEPGMLVHVAPFRHGDSRHSFTSRSQYIPEMRPYCSENTRL